MALEGIWGQFNITVDEKGRMSLPAKIRKHVEGSALVLTKGPDKCLWLYLPKLWEEVSARLVDNASVYSLGRQDILRRFIAPAEEVTLDKAGRVKLSLSLMKSMGITRDCYLLGMGDHLELWDEAVYERFEEEQASVVRETWEGFGGRGSGE